MGGLTQVPRAKAGLTKTFVAGTVCGLVGPQDEARSLAQAGPHALV